ncbi:hypothetical protein SVIO_019020 [Streptomyces violaceusniger]|uniref:Histidine kinase n=1 Tax=Streptomyces violaceusniger TaxID=68280 RepID=A0A4D4KZK7_STRVO|nr:hypothetical protein SVIO_019020 [Streptomyces violaceusniger]
MGDVRLGPVDEAEQDSQLASLTASLMHEAHDDADEDDEVGGIFRARGLKARQSVRTGPVPSTVEQHQQAPDGPGPEPGGGPAPLPRRVPPVLVADHGRPVEGTSGVGHGRTRGPGQPSWAEGSERQGQDQAQGRDQGPRRTGPERREPERRGPEQSPVPTQRAASGLPKRVRQASLAPQLKNDPAPPTDDRTPAEIDPEREAEQARATMASLQRGWQRGRRQSATGSGGADASPGTTHEGDGR